MIQLAQTQAPAAAHISYTQQGIEIVHLTFNAPETEDTLLTRPEVLTGEPAKRVEARANWNTPTLMQRKSPCATNVS